MYAVISDIHGNLDALEAVLRDVPEEVGTIYCLGDVIGYGANPNECCDLVREREMPLITGNHDLAVTDLSTDLAWFNPVSVGQPRDGDTFASYVLAENVPDGPQITYRFVEYDVEKAQTKIRAAGLPNILADRLSHG